jgi:hypothetical protein
MIVSKLQDKVVLVQNVGEEYNASAAMASCFGISGQHILCSGEYCHFTLIEFVGKSKCYEFAILVVSFCIEISIPNTGGQKS